MSLAPYRAVTLVDALNNAPAIAALLSVALGCVAYAPRHLPRLAVETPAPKAIATIGTDRIGVHENHNATAQCQRCGRKLTATASVIRGMGRRCARQATLKRS